VPPSFRRLVVLAIFGASACALPASAPAAFAATKTRALQLGDRQLREGATGRDVRQLQRCLRRVGFPVDVDGEFGPVTASAVRRFQSAARLRRVNGIVGPRTVAALRRAVRGGSANTIGGYDPARADERRTTLGDRIPVREGMSGNDIRVLQRFLRRLGFKVSVDGEFGRGTLAAVRAFERQSGRPVNGVVDAGDIDTLRSTEALGDDPASPSGSTPTTAGATAKVGSDGLAIAPASAPDVVKRIIAAGNQIATKPYRYGGGHGSWNDTGYDCSGSVSYALHGAGLLSASMPSGGFTSWGAPGPGRWVTIYANAGHMYMVVAGLRFDTSGRSVAGTRWQAAMRSSAGYVVRHPPGL
jgi:peptidoglycan hydrolase-like protein with peptidoglycan-binding domain